MVSMPELLRWSCSTRNRSSSDAPSLTCQVTVYLVLLKTSSFQLAYGGISFHSASSDRLHTHPILRDLCFYHSHFVPKTSICLCKNGLRISDRVLAYLFLRLGWFVFFPISF